MLGWLKKEKRATVKVADRFFTEAWGATPSAAGESVTTSSAMGWSAWFACIRNISEDVAKMPLRVYRPRADGGNDLLADHPLNRLIYASPNPEMTSFTFRETLTAHALGHRGGFAEIVRNGAGMVAEMWPLDPNKVRPDIDSQGRLVYLVDGRTTLAGRDVFHIHGLGYEGVTGYVLARLAKEALGSNLAAQKHNGSFFGNGTISNLKIEVPKTLTDDAFKRLSHQLNARYAGAGNHHKPLILEQDAKAQSMSMDAQKSQMIESIEAGVVDTARWFRMPPHKIQHMKQATFSNIESQAIEYVQDTLMSWCVRWEQELARKVFTGRNGDLYAKHNMNSLLRGDQASRAEFYGKMWQVGALSTNDILALEEMNPVEGGDTRYVMGNMMPLGASSMAEAEEQQEAPESKPAVDEEGVRAACKPALAAAYGRVLRIEGDKAKRAEKREELEAWADGFYTHEHAAHVRAEIGPIIDAAAVAMGASLDADTSAGLVVFAAVAAQRHIGRSRKTLHAREGWGDRGDLAAEQDLRNLWMHINASEETN